MSFTETLTTSQESKSAAPLSLKATEKYTDRLRRRYDYDAPKNPDDYTDEQAIALIDLPEAMAQGHLQQAQEILEGDIGTKYERFTFDRLAALGELREAKMGIPTQEELIRSRAEAQRTILTFPLEGFPQNERSALLKGMHGTIEERRKVIDFIENCISNLNAFPNDAKKMRQRDLLRIARDKLFVLYKGLVEFETEEKVRSEQGRREAVSQARRNEEATKARQEIAGIYEDQGTPAKEEVFPQPEAPSQPIRVHIATESPAVSEGMDSKEREAYFQESRERRARRTSQKTDSQREMEVEEARAAVEEAMGQQAEHLTDTTVEKENMPDKETEQPAIERELTKEEMERQKQAALNRGLSIINNIPLQTRQYLFGRYNLTSLQMPLQELQQTVDSNKLDIRVITHLNQQLNRIGMPNPRSPIWQEVGRSSQSEVGRLAQQLEQALVPFLKHLHDISQK